MDEQSFCARVKQCERQLYRVSVSILKSDADAQDAVQEALVNAWIHIGSLREEKYFQTWLIRILINECKRLIKKRRAHPQPAARSASAPPPDPILRHALMALEQNERIMLVLHHLDGYTIEEIARVYHLPQGTVKSRLSRARARLKRNLDKEGLV